MEAVFASYIWLADFAEIVGKNKIQKMIIGLTCLLKINWLIDWCCRFGGGDFKVRPGACARDRKLFAKIGEGYLRIIILDDYSLFNLMKIYNKRFWLSCSARRGTWGSSWRRRATRPGRNWSGRRRNWARKWRRRRTESRRFSRQDEYTGPIGYSDTGLSDNPATVRVFWSQKGPSYNANHRIEWQSLSETFAVSQHCIFNR